MSVRAHRIIEIKTEQEPTFNLSHDIKLRDFLNKEMDFDFELNPHGTGIANIPIEVLVKAIKIAEKLDIDQETVEQLKQDVKAAKSKKENYVAYYCC